MTDPSRQPGAFARQYRRHRSLRAWPLAAFAVATAVVLGTTLAWAARARATEPPQFEATEVATQNGSLTLKWTGSGDAFEVSLQSRRPTAEPARVVYRGHAPAAHISGLRNGEYAAVVRARSGDGAFGDWSAPATIAVAHHDMQTVWWLFGAGLLCVVATVGTLIVSARRSHV